VSLASHSGLVTASPYLKRLEELKKTQAAVSGPRLALESELSFNHRSNLNQPSAERE